MNSNAQIDRLLHRVKISVVGVTFWLIALFSGPPHIVLDDWLGYMWILRLEPDHINVLKYDLAVRCSQVIIQLIRIDYLLLFERDYGRGLFVFDSNAALIRLREAF